MSINDIERIEQELKAIRICLTELATSMKSQVVEARAVRADVLTKKGAARALSIGLTKLNALIASGMVLTVLIGKRQMVPRTEVERLSVPPTPPKSQLRNRRTRSRQAPKQDWAAWLRSQT